MERHNTPGADDVDWYPFVFGCIAGIAPWIVGTIYFAGALGNADEAVPTWVWALFISVFVMFNCFAINQFLQYRGVGPLARLRLRRGRLHRAVVRGQDDPRLADLLRHRPLTPEGGFRPRRLRSIQAVFSWTCMRWVEPGPLSGSSLAASTTGKTDRAVRTTVSWPSTRRRIMASVSGDPRRRRRCSTALRTAVAAGGGFAERSDALSDLVDGERELVVLRLEHEVQRREHRTHDVPVVVVCLQIEGVGVGQQPRVPLRSPGGRPRRCRCRSSSFRSQVASSSRRRLWPLPYLYNTARRPGFRPGWAVA